MAIMRRRFRCIPRFFCLHHIGLSELREAFFFTNDASFCFL